MQSLFSWPSSQAAAAGCTVNDKLDRKYLGFPEARERAMTQVAREIEALLLGEVRSLDPAKEAVGDFLLSVARSPRGDASKAAKTDLVKRVLSSTPGEGGYLMPPGFVNELVKDGLKLSQLYQYVRKIPVPANTGTMPVVGTNATVSWGTENVTISDGDPAFANVSWTSHRMNAVVKMSRELVDDTNPAIVEVVTELMQQAILAERDKVIAVGSGSGKPQGLYSAGGITNVNVTSLTYENLVAIKESVDHRYHKSDPNGSFRWFFNQNVKAKIMQIVDGIGQPVFVNNALTGWQPFLLGAPVSIERSFPNNFIGIGDLQFYMWFDRQQMAMESTTQGDTPFTSHQLWLKVTERCDGKVAIPPTCPFARSRSISGVTDLGT